MKKVLFIIVILISCPVFAVCPIDGATDACIAEFQSASPPASINLVPSNSLNKNFISTPSLTDLSREISPEQNLRMFGPKSQDYGYNSSCQFGVCNNTGTPKNFNVNND